MTSQHTSRFERFGAVRAANWVTVAGVVLVAATIVSGLLNVFRDSVYFGFGGTGQPSPNFVDRLQMFLQQSLGNICFAMLVVAAGVAARVLAARPTASAAAPPVLPEPEMPESPVDLPDRAATAVVLMEPGPDDDVWRR